MEGWGLRWTLSGARSRRWGGQVMPNQQNPHRTSALQTGDERDVSLCLNKKKRIWEAGVHGVLFCPRLYHSLWPQRSRRLSFFRSSTSQQHVLIRGSSCIWQKIHYNLDVVTKSSLISVIMKERIIQMSQILPRQSLKSLLRNKWLSSHFIPLKQ